MTTADVGTQANPLRVAIVGSGPSGFYAADQLQREQKDGLYIEMDMFEKLPTPHGLVRAGVAPDHPKIKSVTRVYDRIAARPNFRFYGNVEFGKDLTHADLLLHYHQIIYAVGAQTDRKLGIPGEDLPGSHAATEFVAWYNGHPGYRDLQFDLSQERVAVIGNGNVAMDVARILARSYDELRVTDIADYALEALANSQVKEIYVLGRRGPVQAAFTNPEIKEFGEMEDADVIVTPAEVDLDPLSLDWLMQHNDRTAEGNVQILTTYAHHREACYECSRRIHMRFLVSPVEFLGEERVDAIKLVKNELYPRADGTLRPRPTDQYETLPVGLAFRSIGYQGVPLPGVPFDQRAGIIPNEEGRIFNLSTGEIVTGEYVVGWVKRGPSGVIGTNKPDAYETVNMMLQDLKLEHINQPVLPRREDLEGLVRVRKPNYISYEDWRTIDEIETTRGQAIGRPRVKFTRVSDVLDALAAYKGRKVEEISEEARLPVESFKETNVERALSAIEGIVGPDAANRFRLFLGKCTSLGIAPERAPRIEIPFRHHAQFRRNAYWPEGGRPHPIPVFYLGIDERRQGWPTFDVPLRLYYSHIVGLNGGRLQIMHDELAALGFASDGLEGEPSISLRSHCDADSLDALFAWIDKTVEFFVGTLRDE
ncbi:MAG: FAD-dependent oxidoreductase [Anaerolineae bacterium]|nr:FAD-dependent oxidoreductase [Anaerolineae bacterium]